MLDLLWKVEPITLACCINFEANSFEERAKDAATLACSCKAGKDFYEGFLIHGLITDKELVSEEMRLDRRFSSMSTAKDILARAGPQVIRRKRILQARNAKAFASIVPGTEEQELIQQYTKGLNRNLDCILARIEEIHADTLLDQLPAHLRQPTMPRTELASTPRHARR